MVNKPQDDIRMTQKEAGPVAKRLKEVREKLGLNPRQFALSAKIDPSQYAKVEKGLQKLGAEKIHGLSATYSINAGWLIGGEGEMFMEKHGQSTTQEKHAANQRSEVIPDPQIPGIYQDIVMELIESSKAQREISKALLEERHLIRETAQAAISLAAHTVESAKEQPSWNMIENRTDVIERSLRDLEKAVVYGFAESLHKKPEEIEVLLHSGWNPGRQSGKKKIAGN